MPRPQRPRAPKPESPLELYLHEINRTRLLSAAEEKELAYRIREGDSEARDGMVRANLRLVVNIARSFNNRGLSLADLIAEGNLGLLRAVEGFNPEMNTRFSTYASYWIRQSIKRALINTGKTIRVPIYIAKLQAKWQRVASRLRNDLGRAPTSEEIAQALKLPRRQATVIQNAFHHYLTSSQLDHDTQGWTIEQLLTDKRIKNSADPDAAADFDYVLQLLASMDEREATVLRMRFGLHDDEPRTLQGIGDRLGLTRERVRQIERLALRKLNTQLCGE